MVREDRGETILFISPVRALLIFAARSAGDSSYSGCLVFLAIATIASTLRSVEVSVGDVSVVSIRFEIGLVAGVETAWD